MTRIWQWTLILVVALGLSAAARQAPDDVLPQDPGMGAPAPPQGPPPGGQLGRRGQGRGGQQGRGGRGGRGGPQGDNFGPMPVSGSNPMTPDKVSIGRQFFFDTRLSADGTFSCASCHKPDRAFADGLAVANGIHDAKGVRNTPSLVNAGYGRSFFWDGRVDTLEQQVVAPMFNPREMGISMVELERRTGKKTPEIADALASYVRTIRSRDSRFDWYTAGQTEMLTDVERRGLDIFLGRGQCNACHNGPRFTDDQFHNTGVGWRGASFADDGRFVVSEDERDRGAFKTPTLRDVALTAPYMHDGSLRTLDDVVEFYSEGGIRNPGQDPRVRPRRFTGDESRAVVAFLKTLTGKISEGF